MTSSAMPGAGPGAVAPEDLRAAVQAGILTEAQAASLTVLAQARAGQRAAMPAEDEPFEFFRGFSEIFVSLGLVILLSGVAAFLAMLGGLTTAAAMPKLQPYLPSLFLLFEYAAAVLPVTQSPSAPLSTAVQVSS